MKFTSVTAHYERKLNTGDYSSVTLGAWATVEVEADDDPAAALAGAMELCRAQVRESAAPFVGRTAVSANEQFAGLPVNGGLVIKTHEQQMELRLPRIGTIRKGAPKPQKGPGKDLDSFLLTAPTRL